ncbi:MAG: alpha/beta fold hydrolase, partial [Hyphomonadaceae bacterium]
MNADDIEAEAEQILARMTTVRRRARPRLAEALYDAHDESVATPFGPVQAWRLGQGPAVLCVHGWEDDNAIWGPLIDTFAAIGRAVVTFDLPGHGYSEAEEATAESCAAAVAAVAKALGPIEAIAAHSFGCVASAAAMDAGLEVSRAVIIASPLPVAFRRARKWVSEGLFSQAALERAMELQAARAGGTFAGFD